MNTSNRPISVSIVACIYLLVGVIAFVRNIQLFGHPGFLWAELTEVLAVIAGVFMLLGMNWARWLALAWMAFHVLLSFGHPVLRTLVAHSLIFALIAWILFRTQARRYFRPT